MLRVSVVREIFSSRISASARETSKPRATPPPMAVALRKVRRCMGDLHDAADANDVRLPDALSRTFWDGTRGDRSVRAERPGHLRGRARVGTGGPGFRLEGDDGPSGIAPRDDAAVEGHLAQGGNTQALGHLPPPSALEDPLLVPALRTQVIGHVLEDAEDGHAHL